MGLGYGVGRIGKHTTLEPKNRRISASLSKCCKETASRAFWRSLILWNPVGIVWEFAFSPRFKSGYLFATSQCRHRVLVMSNTYFIDNSASALSTSSPTSFLTFPFSFPLLFSFCVCFFCFCGVVGSGLGKGWTASFSALVFAVAFFFFFLL